MEELEKLRQKLYSIQKQNNQQQLSQRNCIEIMVKMIDLKMIDIIHTLDGKEYVTHKQLELEIKDEILRSGGRVVITDLQSLLNIDIIHIQDSVDKIKKRDKSIQIYQGEIMTRYYLDSVVQEIQEQLQEIGKIHINDLSNRFSIGIDLLIDVIESRLGKLLKNVIFDNQEVLYTQAHIDRHKHLVIGLFSSITQPCLLSMIIRKYQKNSHYQLNERLVRQQLQELIDSKRINAIIQGKASSAEFIPNIFSQSRSKWIDSFYQQNQFITYESCSKLQISDPISYLKNTFSQTGIPLDTCFINQSLINKIDDNILIDVIESSTWLDISPLLPTSLTNKDISILVSNCSSMKDDKAIFLGDSFIISKSFVDRCFSLLQNTIQEKIENQQYILENIASSSINSKKQQQQQQNDSSEITITNSSTSNKGRNNNNNKKGKNKKEDSSDDEIEEDDYNIDYYDDYEDNQKNQKQQQQQQKKSKKQQQNKMDHLQEITQLLSKWYENMEKDLVKSLSQYLRPLVNQMWENMVKQVREKLENENMKQRKLQQQQLNTQFNTLYNNFLLFKKGLSSLDSNDKSIQTLEKHLLKTVATTITNLLIEMNLNYHMLLDNNNNTNTNISIETPAQRTALLSQLPSQLSKSFEKLIQSLNRSFVDDFIENLEKVCSQSQIKLKLSLDKKIEKQLLEDNKNELEQHLLNENQVGIQFQIIVNLLYIKFKNSYIYAPPRSIGSLVNSLSKDSSIDKQVLKRLNDLHQEIVKLIINNKSPSNTASEEINSNEIINDNINYFKDLIFSNKE